MCLTELRSTHVSGITPAINAIFDCFSHFGVQEAVEKSDGKSLEEISEKIYAFFYARHIEKYLSFLLTLTSIKYLKT